MKVNDQFRCGEEIYVENESDPTCGSDMVEFPPWDQCVSKPYVYSLFSFKKDKIDICPFTSPLHSDAIPVCLKYTWPLYFESNNVDMDVNGEDDNCFVYFLYTTEDDGGSGSTLFRFSTASKRVIQISRDEDQVLSFCLNDGKGLYTATWYQGNQKYWGIFLFQGRYPFTVYNIYEIEESTVDWQDSDTVSPTPQVQYKDGTYFVSSFPYDDKSSGEIKRCFLKISIEFGSKIVIETIPALSDLLITEMIFLGNKLICIDSTSPFPHFGKGVQKVYSYCSDTNKRSLLTTACGCCNLSGKENVLFFELQGLDNEESGLVWNKLDETHQSILETKNCTDFSGVVFDGSRLAATEWNSCGYDGDEERISFFHLPSGEVTHIERVFDDLIQLTLHDKYLFVYDKDGFDRDGYDRDGYDRDGYDRDGYDRGGYDRDGYDRGGYDRDGYDRGGYDRDGHDRDGYNKAGYNRDGYNRVGSDMAGHAEVEIDKVGLVHRENACGETCISPGDQARKLDGDSLGGRQDDNLPTSIKAARVLNIKQRELGTGYIASINPSNNTVQIQFESEIRYYLIDYIGNTIKCKTGDIDTTKLKAQIREYCKTHKITKPDKTPDRFNTSKTGRNGGGYNEPGTRYNSGYVAKPYYQPSKNPVRFYYQGDVPLFSEEWISRRVSVERTKTRGWYLYQSGSVLKLQRSQNGLEYLGIVRGSTGINYSCFFTLSKDGNIEKWHCNCPAFSKYKKACKHLVAMFYAARNDFGG